MTALSVALAILLLGGLPIAFSFGLAAVIGLWFEGLPFLNLASRMFAGLDSFVLLAAPFYIVCGELMNRGGISERLIRFSTLIVGRIRGGTAYAAIVASVLFAGISGTAIADIAALGQIFINSMPKEGYSKAFAAALVTAGSIIGPIIPPSVIMVLYAAVAEVSVLRLFLGGIVPGLLLGLACGAVVFVKGLRGELPRSSMVVPRPERPKAFRDGLLVLTLPGFIVFGTLSGVFTPTEAGVVAAVIALAIGGLIHREIGPAQIYAAMLSAAKTSAIVMFLIAAALVSAWLITIANVPAELGRLLEPLIGAPRLLMAAMMAVVALAGTALDFVPTVLILTPILMPLVRLAGIDPVYFGVLFIINNAIGLITPPVGVVLNVVCGVARVSMDDAVRGSWPFVLALFAVLALLVLFPALVLVPARLLS